MDGMKENENGIAYGVVETPLSHQKALLLLPDRTSFIYR